MTVQTTSAALAPATIVARVVAFIIDGIAVSILGWILGLIVGDTSAVGGVIRSIIYAALGFVYFGYTWTAWRATPGQRALGLLTVNEDSSTLTWNQATMRWAYLFGPSVAQNLFVIQFGGALGSLIGIIVFGYYVYLLYTAATDPRKQGFHDKQSHTMVVAKTAP